jgi:uncharacterized protein (TIGR03086 family)
MTNSDETISQRYRRLSDRFAHTVAGITPEQWDHPTPCTEWTVRQLVGHVIDTQSMFANLVGRQLSPGPSVEEDPAAAWDHARRQTQAALDDPALAGAAFDGQMGRSTFERAVDRFLSFDLVVHGWDLAEAVGGDTSIADHDLDFLERQMEFFGDVMEKGGATKAPLDPPPGADRRTRVLARLGRAA